MDIKESATDFVDNTVRKMVGESAFVAFLLIIIVLLLAWFLYTNHMLNQQVIDMRLLDFEREAERFKVLEKWGSWIGEIKADVKDIHRADARYKEMLREIRNTQCAK